MYVSVKGGEKAINNAHSWLSEIRRGDVNIAELNIKQISEQLTLSVDRVMSEDLYMTKICLLLQSNSLEVT